MFQRILVPLDGSELAERALEPAFTIAKQANGEVILLSVPFPKPIFVQEQGWLSTPLPVDSLNNTEKELADYLQAKTAVLSHPDCTVETEIIDGDAASVIVDTAAAKAADLIVMSTHGRSGFSRWMLGSVTERVLRNAPCPVLAIRSTAPISRVLIPLDRSELAGSALEPGLDLARTLDCQVTLLTVMKSVHLTSSEWTHLESLESGLVRHFKDNLHAEHASYLRFVARTQVYLPEQAIKTAVAEGSAAEQILEFAERQQTDLIVMATHGYTGLRRWVYGSVTEKVLRGTTCSMLVVRPPLDELN